jgi:hypothetical protein
MAGLSSEQVNTLLRQRNTSGRTNNGMFDPKRREGGTRAGTSAGTGAVAGACMRPPVGRQNGAWVFRSLADGRRQIARGL